MLILNCKITKKLKTAQHLNDNFLRKDINRFQRLQNPLSIGRIEKIHFFK